MPDISQDPPLVDLKVTNPITFIKIWWKKIIGNEGIDVRFHVRPLTALAIAIVFASISFGVGKFVLPFRIPFFEYNSTITPLPTVSSWKETGFTGTLQFSSNTKTYYLITTSSSEAITLNVPENIDLESMVGKRIFAAGDYNKNDRKLVVKEAKDLEILPKKPIPAPTLEPETTASPTVTPISEPLSPITEQLY